MKTLRELENDTIALRTTHEANVLAMEKLEKELVADGVDLDNPDAYLEALDSSIAADEAEYNKLFAETEEALTKAKEAMSGS